MDPVMLFIETTIGMECTTQNEVNCYGIRTFPVRPKWWQYHKGNSHPSNAALTLDEAVTILPVSLFSNDDFIMFSTKHGWNEKTPLKASWNLTQVVASP